MTVATPPSKICSLCKQEKLITEFIRDKRATSGYGSRCRGCNREKCREYQNKNRESLVQKQRTFRQANLKMVRERRRKWDRDNPKKVREGLLRRKYKIDMVEYEAMLNSQAGVCAMCQNPETKTYRGKLRTLCVDHDHTTGKVRALLCSSCNLLIGHAADNISRLLAAVAYLEKHGNQHATE